LLPVRTDELRAAKRPRKAGGSLARPAASPRMRRRASRARVATVALLTAGTVVLAGGGEAFWLSLPAALLVTALARSRVGALVGAAAVTAAAGLPLAGWLRVRALPSPGLALLVVAASVLVLVAARERLERERESLRSVAESDPLTGIANRRLLLSRAEYEIARHLRARQKFALVMLDLDGFKLLNDRFGHTAGDELLCDVAAALSRAMRGQDTVARIGGDEFCVLAPQTDKLHAMPLARRIADTVSAATAGIETLRASVGIAVFPDDGRDAAALLHAADTRLLSAKRSRQGARARRRVA
jgi:diguanylate cyclase (GGDEF)-like protein